LRISLKDMRISIDKIKKMLRIGVPSGIQGTLFSLSNVIIQSSINSFGDVVVSGSAAASSLEGFLYIAMNSMYHVTLTFVGQNVGAKKFGNIRRIVAYSTILVTAIGMISGAVVLLFRYPLIKLYVSSEASMNAAMQRLWIISLTYFICGIMEVFSGMLRAMDRSVTSMVISLAGACGLRIIWILTVFKWVPYPQTVYFSYPVTWTATVLIQMAVSFAVLRKIIKKNSKAALLET